MPTLVTLRDHIYWSYANLSMAHAAITKGRSSYGPGSYSIRSAMWRRLNDGSASPRSLVFDEKEKMRRMPICAYCGGTKQLSADHLLPTSKGGPDAGTNLVRACRICNSSKSNRDLWTWYQERDEFPPLLVVRRYFKCVYQWAEDAELLDLLLQDCSADQLPFDVDYWPSKFPPPAQLRMEVERAGGLFDV